MSELINNREYRQKVLKELIMDLHHGKSVDEVRERFAKLIEGVSTEEIAQMEQNLIMEGMPVEEVQRLCDVHAAVFKGSIQDIHRPNKAAETPGHPVHTLRQENRAIEKLIAEQIEPLLGQLSPEAFPRLASALEKLGEVDKHYSRKENLIFPYLEEYGITAPPQVMWGVDDEIRDQLKEAKSLLAAPKVDPDQVAQKTEEVVSKITEMIYKEENILFPMALDNLTEDQWATIAQESEEIGFCLIAPPPSWKPQRVEVAAPKETQEAGAAGAVRFETGVLSFKEINAILNRLPVDITFVDKDDVVKYFSQSPERIFPRPKTVIGRKVHNCHPPASMHVVEKLVADLKAGRKDHEDFWIKMGDVYALIRYFAVRDENGEYLGTLEVTQNIKPLQEIQGEKRLLSN
ncbi:MAG: DUF438 domain-containing protein [Firmicutes bacterium]|jgi:DUF438 domain-containing protein|nr:DUF438 domain-containing protein [Bacillota bacterium]